MFRIDLYVPEFRYRNRFGDIIQPFDTYGISKAVRQEHTGETLIFSAFASSREYAMERIKEYIYRNNLVDLRLETHEL